MLIIKRQKIYKTTATVILLILFLLVLFFLYDALCAREEKNKLSCPFDPFVTKNSMEIDNLNFTGVSNQMEQYQIHISQVLHNMDDVYFGKNIDIQYPMNNNEMLYILAAQGAFYSERKTINLHGGARLLYKTWQIKVNAVDINLAERSAYGRDGILLKLDEKKMKCYINSDKFQIHNQEVILEKNKVRIILSR